jgi:hypothetical protein
MPDQTPEVPAFLLKKPEDISIGPSDHVDNVAVDRFAHAMKIRLAQKRNEGYRGWDDAKICNIRGLQASFYALCSESKLRCIDAANYLMMIWNRQEMKKQAEQD